MDALTSFRDLMQKMDAQAECDCPTEHLDRLRAICERVVPPAQASMVYNGLLTGIREALAEQRERSAP